MEIFFTDVALADSYHLWRKKNWWCGTDWGITCGKILVWHWLTVTTYGRKINKWCSTDWQLSPMEKKCWCGTVWGITCGYKYWCGTDWAITCGNKLVWHWLTVITYKKCWCGTVWGITCGHKYWCGMDWANTCGNKLVWRWLTVITYEEEEKLVWHWLTVITYGEEKNDVALIDSYHLWKNWCGTDWQLFPVKTLVQHWLAVANCVEIDYVTSWQLSQQL